MDKPILLDLFCGGGGATRGYQQAGFYVIGVDIAPQPHYCGDEFIQGDAMTYPLNGYDVIHASPVCKAYTQLNLSPHSLHPKLIGAIRARLAATKKIYIIENVMQAKHDMQANLMLCASMFDLPMRRHRLFEIGNTDIFFTPPGYCNHKRANIQIVGNTTRDASLKGTTRKDGRIRPAIVPIEVGYKAMKIDWMNRYELSQAIPPCYTAWIGKKILEHLELEGKNHGTTTLLSQV